MSPLSRRALESRAARARRTDAKILDAALALAADEGWAALVHHRVAEAAGLSRQPLSDRYVDRSELAADLWRSRVHAPAESALADLLRAAGLLAAEDDAPGEGEEGALATALEAFAMPDLPLKAAAELLAVATYDHRVRAAVAETLGATVRSWCAPRPPRLDRVTAARRAYLLNLGLGLILTARLPGRPRLEFGSTAADLRRILALDLEPVRLPASRPRHLEGDLPFAPDDPELDSLLNAALREFARDGYEGASLLRIARSAGISMGILRGRYPTKLGLFADTLQRQAAIGLSLNEAFMTKVEATGGSGIAQAVMLREWLRPEGANARAVTVEHLRIAAHDPELGKATVAQVDGFTEQLHVETPGRGAKLARTEAFVSLAIGSGPCVLPVLYADAWQLPFDVVMVPGVEESSPA